SCWDVVAGMATADAVRTTLLSECASYPVGGSGTARAISGAGADGFATEVLVVRHPKDVNPTASATPAHATRIAKRMTSPDEMRPRGRRVSRSRPRGTEVKRT